MKKIRSFSVYQVFSCLLLIACFVATVFFIRGHLTNDLDSDNASELILGRLLAEEGDLITEKWYYGNELYVLNTNLFYSAFFRLFDSWHRVRLFSLISMYLVLLVSYYWMCSVYNIKKYFALSAALLIVPFSNEYYNFVLKGAYYLPYINFAFLVLTLSELFIKSSGKKQYFIAIISFLLSVILGLAGGRELVFLFFPLFIAALYFVSVRYKEKSTGKWFVYASLLLCGNIIGFIINSSILSEYYHFKNWGNAVSFTEFSVPQLVKVISSLLYSLGYESGSLSFNSLLHNFICMSWIILIAYSIIYSIIKQYNVLPGYARLSTVCTSMYIIFLIYYCFTDSYLNNRYIIPVMILSFPCIASFLEQVHWNENIKKAIYVVITLLTCISGMLFYYDRMNKDSNAELRSIAKDLTAKGFYNGYATFWNANILTELSNGKIDVWSIASKSENLKEIDNIDNTYKCLQMVSHDTTHPEGKVFVLFTRYESWNNNWQDVLPYENIIINGASYIVYGFDDYDSLTGYLYPGS